MGPIVSNHASAYARLAGPPILVGQARKTDFNSPTPLLVDYNVTIKENLGDFVLLLTNSWFGTKPMVSSTLLYK